MAASSTYSGIYAGGSGGTYSGDHELNNAGSGLSIAGQKMTITGNVANGNGSEGIYDYGFGNKLTNNTADFNGRDGINASDVAVIDGALNKAKGNDYNTGVRVETGTGRARCEVRPPCGSG